jgi:alginate O-acetyltransferase complex protein AlgI
MVHNLNEILAVGHLSLPVPKLILPLGISFFTFHKISYHVDVYRGVAEVRRKPMDLALYILFFPQLIAGPIVRYFEIANELARRTTRREDFAEGIRRFIFGLGKKMIVANTAAYSADQVFNVPATDLTTGIAWLGVICYTIQIYFDFSGYSDMAIGLARMFGFHFPENFNYPYIAQSITEFWRRWHMSLSRWFRDYVYIPMGGNRCSPARVYFNLVAVFFLCGLWHGAQWTFVLWGLYHGALLVIERLGFGKILNALPRVFRHIYTLLAIMIGWTLFRAPGLGMARCFLKAMAGFSQGDGAVFNAHLFLNNELVLILAVALIGATPIRNALTQYLDRQMIPVLPGHRVRLAALRMATVTSSVIWQMAVLFYSVVLMAAQTYSPFIYFRF